MLRVIHSSLVCDEYVILVLQCFLVLLCAGNAGHVI